jgi:hypothetical protein
MNSKSKLVSKIAAVAGLIGLGAMKACSKVALVASHGAPEAGAGFAHSVPAIVHGVESETGAIAGSMAHQSEGIAGASHSLGDLPPAPHDFSGTVPVTHPPIGTGGAGDQSIGDAAAGSSDDASRGAAKEKQEESWTHDVAHHAIQEGAKAWNEQREREEENNRNGGLQPEGPNN